MATAQPADQVRAVLDSAGANGLMVILWVHTNVTSELLREWVTALKEHPALLAWYVYDEPSEITPQVQEKYDIARTLDPGRPAYVNYVLYPRDQLGDIASLDDYPIPKNGPAVIAGDAETLERSAAPAGKPSWIWLQDMGYAYFVPREPTAPEVECMTYLALIHGVRGIKFFAQKPRSKELWNRMQWLAREVRELTPVLYALEDSPAVSAAPETIHAVAKRHRGETYIIAANDCPKSLRATLGISGPDGTAAVLFEDRSVRVSEGRLRDRFEPYQRHVYRLSATARAPD